MKKRKLLTIIGAISIIMSTQACAYTEERSAAVSEIEKARSMGNEWRDSMKLVEKADKANEANDTETAAKLIAKAKKQGIDAQIQAKAQMDVSGPH